MKQMCFFPKINAWFGHLCNGRNRTLWLKYLLQWLGVMDPPAGKGEPAEELSVSLRAPGKQMVHALSFNSWKVLVPMGDASCLGVILAVQGSPRSPPHPHSPWRGDGHPESTALHLMVLTSKKSSQRLKIPITARHRLIPRTKNCTSIQLGDLSHGLEVPSELTTRKIPYCLLQEQQSRAWGSWGSNKKLHRQVVFNGKH